MIDRLPDFHFVFVGHLSAVLVAKWLKLDLSGLKRCTKPDHFLQVPLLTLLAELVALLLVQSEGRQLFSFSQGLQHI